MPLPIRWRLTLWNTLALAVLLLGFAGLVYGLLARQLYQRIDRSLTTVLRELERKPDQDLSHWIDEALDHERVFCVVFDRQGQVRARTRELAAGAVPPAPEPWPETVSHQQARLPIIGRQRVLTAAVECGAPSAVVLLAPLEEVDRELRGLAAVLFMVVPAALAVAGGFGYLLARKALAPVEQLNRLTEEINAERLDRRLPAGPANDEIGRLARTINAMIGRLEHSFTEIRRFTADASHELRTPLAAIRIEAEVALGRTLGPAEAQQLLASILEECAARLTRLTDQLLMLAREDAGEGRPPAEALDLADLVKASAETMRPLAEAREIGLTIAADGPFPLLGAPSRLRQVFHNLLDNAIKYTPAGGQVEVCLDRSECDLRVVVRDSGIGIPAEHLPRVFDRFYRVDQARSRAEGGTGLGLSIARTIVLSHGGTIALASSPGQGTACTVTLPARRINAN